MNKRAKRMNTVKKRIMKTSEHRQEYMKGKGDEILKTSKHRQEYMVMSKRVSRMNRDMNRLMNH